MRTLSLACVLTLATVGAAFADSGADARIRHLAQGASSGRTLVPHRLGV
jgi:hypothetical protein